MSDSPRAFSTLVHYARCAWAVRAPTPRHWYRPSISLHAHRPCPRQNGASTSDLRRPSCASRLYPGTVWPVLSAGGLQQRFTIPRLRRISRCVDLAANGQDRASSMGNDVVNGGDREVCGSSRHAFSSVNSKNNEACVDAMRYFQDLVRWNSLLDPEVWRAPNSRILWHQFAKMPFT